LGLAKMVEEAEKLKKLISIELKFDKDEIVFADEDEHRGWETDKCNAYSWLNVI
jgi:hypothetical protein